MEELCNKNTNNYKDDNPGKNIDLVALQLVLGDAHRLVSTILDRNNSVTLFRLDRGILFNAMNELLKVKEMMEAAEKESCAVSRPLKNARCTTRDASDAAVRMLDLMDRNRQETSDFRSANAVVQSSLNALDRNQCKSTVMDSISRFSCREREQNVSNTSSSSPFLEANRFEQHRSLPSPSTAQERSEQKDYACSLSCTSLLVGNHTVTKPVRSMSLAIGTQRGGDPLSSPGGTETALDNKALISCLDLLSEPSGVDRWEDDDSLEAEHSLPTTNPELSDETKDSDFKTKTKTAAAFTVFDTFSLQQTTDTVQSRVPPFGPGMIDKLFGFWLLPVIKRIYNVASVKQSLKRDYDCLEETETKHFPSPNSEPKTRTKAISRKGRFFRLRPVLVFYFIWAILAFSSSPHIMNGFDISFIKPSKRIEKSALSKTIKAYLVDEYFIG